MVAIQNDGNSTNKMVNKTIHNLNRTYRYTQYLFDFKCVSIELWDKAQDEHLLFLCCPIHIRIEDNCIILTCTSRMAGKKTVLTQFVSTEMQYTRGTLTIESDTIKVVIK